MNAISMKSFFYRFQHPFDELIGFFLSYLKDVGSVFDLLPDRPFQGIVEMGQSLDTGNQFYSEFLRIIIHFTDFRCAVSASVSSEIRFVFYLVSVLCVKHQHIHSHACQDADHGFHFLHSEDAVAGAVQHQTVSWEIRSFPFFICFLIQIVQKPGKSTVIMGRFLAGDLCLCAGSLYNKIRSVCKGYFQFCCHAVFP